MSKVIHKKVTIGMEPKGAFLMFTVNELIESWLAEAAHIEPFVGGAYELSWTSEKKREDSTLGCKITALERNQLLCFDWKGPAQFEKTMNQAEPLTHVSIALIPYDGGQTHIHLIHTGWQEGEEWDEAREWFDRVWTNAFQTLANITSISLE